MLNLLHVILIHTAVGLSFLGKVIVKTKTPHTYGETRTRRTVQEFTRWLGAKKSQCKCSHHQKCQKNDSQIVWLVYQHFMDHRIAKNQSLNVAAHRNHLVRLQASYQGKDLPVKLRRGTIPEQFDSKAGSSDLMILWGHLFSTVGTCRWMTRQDFPTVLSEQSARSWRATGAPTASCQWLTQMVTRQVIPEGLKLYSFSCEGL